MIAFHRVCWRFFTIISLAAACGGRAHVTVVATQPAPAAKPLVDPVIALDSRNRTGTLKNGLRYVFTGNVYDEAGGSTYCHQCGQKLIGRDWYRLTAWNLTADGACNRCGTPVAGVFDAEPGTWGSRRLPVRMGR